MNSTLKTVVFWIVIVFFAMLLWQVVRSAPRDHSSSEITYSRFISDVGAGNVASVTISGDRIQGWYRDGGSFHLTGPGNVDAYLDALSKKGVEIRFIEGNSLPLQLLGTWAPLLLLAALWFFMIRQMKRRNSVPPPNSPVGPGPL